MGSIGGKYKNRLEKCLNFDKIIQKLLAEMLSWVYTINKSTFALWDKEAYPGLQPRLVLRTGNIIYMTQRTALRLRAERRGLCASKWPAGKTPETEILKEEIS